VVPNPAPELPQLPVRDELRRELGLDGKTLVFAGRLGPQKALGTLLHALVEVPDATLVVAGDGPEREPLEQLTRTLGLDGRVTFLGAVPRERVLRLFGAADACVVPSAWENLPHTVVEALAVGCPVIATSVGGVPEVVRDGENGLLVAPGDSRALANAIARLLSDDALRERLSAAAPGSVASYSEGAVFSRIEDELQRAYA
jgi:glycosyltransferase involved in cell wall biosynthesis